MHPEPDSAIRRWRRTEFDFAQEMYALIKATPGAEAFCDAGFWDAAEMKTFLQNVNRKYSPQLINDKAAWEPIIAQVRTVLETY